MLMSKSATAIKYVNIGSMIFKSGKYDINTEIIIKVIEYKTSEITCVLLTLRDIFCYSYGTSITKD